MKKLFHLIFSLVCSISVFGQDVKVIRGPYLQVLTPTSIVVRWRTDVPTDSEVRYGTNYQYILQNSTKDSPKKIDHEIKISGLEPNTKYFYSVGNVFAVLRGGQDCHFWTAPLTGSTQKIRIWAMGDMGDGSLNQAQVRDAYLTNTGQQRTDMVLMLGDNAYGSGYDSEYQANFFDFYQNRFLQNIPMFQIPGNHEYYSGTPLNRDVDYFKIFSMPTQGEGGGVPSGQKSYYSFDYGNAHIVALDSYGVEEGKYRIYNPESPQIQWLIRDLSANRQPWTIVMFHHPPYTKNSHDSDFEEELARIRQNLTPILERFKVDLVLSGHSHIYERSYPIRGHQGYSFTFSPFQHATSTSSGRYDGSANSCPYIKTDGTIYTVAGSSGQLDALLGFPPQPSSAYYNLTEGGSLIIEIEDNRLDAKWLNNANVVKDQFTVFKNNVNQVKSLSLKNGEKATLSASWNGNYLWSDGVNTSKNLEIKATKSGNYVYTVRDKQGCLQDRFDVTVIVPKVIPNAPSASVCAGDKFSVNFLTEKNEENNLKYKVQLSDNQGNFNDTTAIGEGLQSPIEISIPKTVKAGSKYRLRVVSNSQFLEHLPSETFKIQNVATADLSGTRIINIGESTNLTINFTGDAPYNYEFLDGTKGTSNTTSLSLPFVPQQTTTYGLKSVSNVCGNGTTSGQATVTVIPRITTDVSETQVCQNGKLAVAFSVGGSLKTGISYTAELSNIEGEFNKNSIVLGTSTQSPINITIPRNLALSNKYKIRVTATDTSTFVASNTLIVKPLPTANISGISTINIGENSSLSLVFTGDAPYNYELSDGTKGSSSASSLRVTLKPQQTTTYTLTSINNSCGEGTATGQATINVIPKIITNLTTTQTCQNSQLAIAFGVMGNFKNGTTFTAQLSDSLGIFKNPLSIGTATQSPIAATIPKNLPWASKYKIRVTASDTATFEASNDLIVKPLATAQISGGASIVYGEEVLLNISFTADSPWNFELSDGTKGSTTVSPFTQKVKPLETTKYTLKSINNACGEGITSGEATVTVLVLGINPVLQQKGIVVYPNPTYDYVFVNYDLTKSQKITWYLADAKGTILKQNKNIDQHQERINLQNLPNGTYTLVFELDGQRFSSKIRKQ